MSPVEEGVFICWDCLGAVVLLLLPVALGQLELLDFWSERRLELALKQLVEIDVFEKPVLFEILGSVLKVAISFTQVSAQEVLYKRFALAVEPVGVSWLCVDNFAVNVHGIIVLEGRVACQHLVQ